MLKKAPSNVGFHHEKKDIFEKYEKNKKIKSILKFPIFF